MNFEFLHIRILSLCLFFIILKNAESGNKKWLDHFMTHIKSDKEVNQVTLITETDARNLHSEIEELRILISWIIPSRKINFEQARVEEAEKENRLQQFYDPRATLFLIIPSEAEDYLPRLTRTINYLTLLCRARRRPKVLLILPQVRKNASIQEFLKLMWSKQFLDVSLLELHQQETIKKSSIYSREEKKVAVKFHSYLPFTDSFIEKKYFSKIDLFPEKLRNLEKYQLKIGIFHYPPYVFLTHSSKGELDSYYGPDIEALRALSKTLNFRISAKISKKADWDKASCIKEGNKGLLHDIAYNEISLIAVQSIIISPCMIDVYEQSSGFRPFYYYVALAPTVPNEVSSLTTEWTIYNVGILVILPMITWIFTRILRFEERNWQMEDIVRVILGWTIPEEPHALAERIVLGSMLISCFLHSSFIFTAFTTINLQKEQDVTTKTVEKLVEAGIKTLVSQNIFDMLVPRNTHLDGLLSKAVKTSLTDDECVEHLIKFRNITCLMRDSRAYLMIESKRKKYGKSVMRVVAKFKMMFPTGVKMEGASPYVQRFDLLALRFRESGIVAKWDEKFIKRDDKPDQVDVIISEFIESTKIQRQIFILLGFGFVLSFVAFIGEILVHLGRKVLSL